MSFESLIAEESLLSCVDLLSLEVALSVYLAAAAGAGAGAIAVSAAVVSTF